MGAVEDRKYIDTKRAHAWQESGQLARDEQWRCKGSICWEHKLDFLICRAESKFKFSSRFFWAPWASLITWTEAHHTYMCVTLRKRVKLEFFFFFSPDLTLIFISYISCLSHVSIGCWDGWKPVWAARLSHLTHRFIFIFAVWSDSRIFMHCLRYIDSLRDCVPVHVCVFTRVWWTKWWLMTFILFQAAKLFPLAPKQTEVSTI